MNRSIASIVVLLALSLGTMGCQSGQTEENCIPAKGPNTVGSAAVNTNCPLTGEHADQAVVEEYQGKKIAFCCQGCARRFLKMNDAEKDKVLAKATMYPGR